MHAGSEDQEAKRAPAYQSAHGARRHQRAAMLLHTGLLLAALV